MRPLLAASAMILGGCATGQPRPLSPEQLSAIQTREVDWDQAAAFQAAAAVLLDDGYLFTMSDSAAGLVAGSRMGGGVEDHVTVWVQAISDHRSAVRVDYFNPYGWTPDRDRVTRFATKLNERALAYAPASGGTR
jgi:hypothetical protein